jgi:hypothetical protein
VITHSVAIDLLLDHCDVVVRDRLAAAKLHRFADDEIRTSIEQLAHALPRMLLRPAIEHIERQKDPREVEQLAGILIELFLPPERSLYVDVHGHRRSA